MFCFLVEVWTCIIVQCIAIFACSCTWFHLKETTLPAIAVQGLEQRCFSSFALANPLSWMRNGIFTFSGVMQVLLYIGLLLLTLVAKGKDLTRAIGSIRVMIELA